MEYVTLANGDVRVTSQDCPTEIVNHVRDKRDRRLFHPAFPACRYRSSSCEVKPCGKLAVSWWCSEKRQLVTVPICEACEVEPKT